MALRRLREPMPDWVQKLRGEVKSPWGRSRGIVKWIVKIEIAEDITGWLLVLQFGILLGSFANAMTRAVMWLSWAVILLEGMTKATRRWAQIYEGLKCAEILANWHEMRIWSRYSVLLRGPMFLLQVFLYTYFILSAESQNRDDYRYYGYLSGVTQTCWDNDNACSSRNHGAEMDAWLIEHRWQQRLSELLHTGYGILIVHSAMCLAVILSHIALRLRLGPEKADGDGNLTDGSIKGGERVPSHRQSSSGSFLHGNLSANWSRGRRPHGDMAHTLTYWFRLKWIAFREMTAEELTLYVHFRRHMLLGGMAASQADECELSALWFLRPEDVLQLYDATHTQEKLFGVARREEKKIAILEVAMDLAYVVRDWNEAELLLKLADKALSSTFPMLMELGAKIFTRIILRADVLDRGANGVGAVDPDTFFQEGVLYDVMCSLTLFLKRDGSLKCMQAALLAQTLYCSLDMDLKTEVLFEGYDFWNMLAIPVKKLERIFEPSVERAVVLECLIRALRQNWALTRMPYEQVVTNCFVLLRCDRTDLEVEITLAARLLYQLLRHWNRASFLAVAPMAETLFMQTLQWASFFALRDVGIAVMEAAIWLAKGDLEATVRLLANDIFQSAIVEPIRELYETPSMPDLLALAEAIAAGVSVEEEEFGGEGEGAPQQQEGRAPGAMPLAVAVQKAWVLLYLCKTWRPSDKLSKIVKNYWLDSFTLSRPLIEAALKKPEFDEYVKALILDLRAEAKLDQPSSPFEDGPLPPRRPSLLFSVALIKWRNLKTLNSMRRSRQNSIGEPPSGAPDDESERQGDASNGHELISICVDPPAEETNGEGRRGSGPSSQVAQDERTQDSSTDRSGSDHSRERQGPEGDGKDR